MNYDDPNGLLDFNATAPPPPKPVGIYGWRKRCLYASVLLLMIVVIMNLTLTIWILRVMRFSFDGMGHLKVVPYGVQLKAEAEFMKTVYAHHVRAEDNPLFLESSKSVQLLTIDKKRKVKSQLVLDQDNVTASCDTFRVVDSNGNINFQVSANKVFVGNGDATFLGDVKLAGAIITPTVLSPINSSLNITSESSTITISALGAVSLSSTLGNVTIATEDNIILKSGTLNFTVDNLYLAGIPTLSVMSSGGQMTSSSRPTTSSPMTSWRPPKVYQLCICASGKVFLGDASGDCNAGTGDC